MFRYALDKLYHHPSVSPLNQFGFITPNEWNTFQQLHTTLNNKMKELLQKNKFKHKLGPGGDKATIPLWTKKEHELHEAWILDPLEGCMLRTETWIRGWSHIDGSRRLVTSNSDITRMIENSKNIITK
jgi:hypothetical protein